MTTLDALHAALDATPGDALCRLAIADYLDENGLPGGPGYRALGTLDLAPRYFTHRSVPVEYTGRYGFSKHPTHTTPGAFYADSWEWWIFVPYEPAYDRRRKYGLVSVWLALVDGRIWGNPKERVSVDFGTRRAAEDAAAVAFTRLPPARQAALLAEAVACAS